MIEVYNTAEMMAQIKNPLGEIVGFPRNTNLLLGLDDPNDWLEDQLSALAKSSGRSLHLRRNKDASRINKR